MRKRPSAHASRGFTLIEVMITVAVVAIIAAVAVPAYQGYVVRGKLADGTSALADARMRMEQHYQDNRNYDCTEFNAMPASRYFTLTCANPTSTQNFTITATGIAAEGTGGYAYSVDQDNNRLTTAFPDVGAKSCWIYKAGDQC